MSSIRAKKLREQNVVVKLVKDLNKRMGDFENSVDELKILKDSITEMHYQIVTQEEENKNQLIRLRTELKNNRIRILNESAEEIGKVLISAEELAELREEVKRLNDHYLTLLTFA